MKKIEQPPIRIAYLVSHPIQYQAPLLREIAKVPEFDLTVFFRTDFSTRNFQDPDFGAEIQWDTDLLNGYHFEVLPAIGKTNRLTFWQPFNYGLLRRLKKGNFKVLWVHSYAPPFNLYAIIAAKLLSIKVLVRDEATPVSKHRGKLKIIIKKRFFNCLDILIDGYLAIGTMNKQYYLYNGVPEEKIFDMPYAVDNQYFKKQAEQCLNNREELRESLGLKKERPVILYASKLTQRKRALDLLEAFQYVLNIVHPKPYLLFIGDGEMRSLVEKRVQQLSLSNDVFLLGFKNQSELPCFYDLCDVFVLPSLHEPWGLVINEAMNAGRSIIASDQVGSAHDLINQGRNGFVFQAGNIQGLVQTLVETLKDPIHCRDMGLASLKIISNWGFEEDIKGLKKAISAVLSE